MKLKLRTWTARTLTAGALLVAAFAAPPTFAQQVNPSDVLTEDVIVRVLGMEKANNAFTPPAAADKEKLEKVNKVKQAFADAIIAFQRGDAGTAEAKLKEAKGLDDSLSMPAVYLARLCFAVNDQNLVKVGRAFLDKAENDDPTAPEPYMMLGNLALLEGRLADASLNFKQAALLVGAKKETWSKEQTDTFLKNVYGGMVSVNEQRGNWSKGLDGVNLWIGLDPNDAVAVYRKARLEFMSDPKTKTEDARELFKQAYDLAKKAPGKKAEELPSVPPPELALIELQTQTGNVDAARKEVEKIDEALKAEQNPKEQSRINSTISQWYLGQGEFKKGEKYAENALSIDKDSPAVKQLVAVLEYFSGAETAEASFTKLNQDAPEDMFAANYLALVLIEKPDETKRAKAVRVAELSARLNPKSPVALATLGWCYYKTGRLGEAAQIFAALEQEKNLQISADMAYYMAKTFGALPVDQFPNGISRGRQLLEKVITTQGAFKHKEDAVKQYLAWGGSQAVVDSANAAPKSANAEIAPKVTTPPATSGSGTTNPSPTTPPATNPTPNGDNK